MPAQPDTGPTPNLVPQAAPWRSWAIAGLGISIAFLLGTLAVFAVLGLFLPFEPVMLPLARGALHLDPIFRTVALALVSVAAALALFHGGRLAWRRFSGKQNQPEGEENVGWGHNLASLQRALMLAGAGVALGAVAWGACSARLPTALLRALFPLADIPPESGVAYDVLPGDALLLREGALHFTARVTEGEAEGLRLVVYGANGAEPRCFPLEKDGADGQLFHADVDAQGLGAGYRDGLTYRVYGGGTWSKLKTIHFVDRPVVASVTAVTLLPGYARLSKAVAAPPQGEVLGIEKGTVRVRVQARGEVASGRIQLLRTVVRPLPPEQQQETAWVKDGTPPGSRVGGNWVWEKQEGRRVHTGPAGPGMSGHWFCDDPDGLQVNKGDVLYAHVFLPEGQAPTMLALEWHDGENWEHRAYWGENKLLDGAEGAASRRRVGPAPQAGRWVRLEVPAGLVGLEGKTVSGMAFKAHGGRALWGQTGTVRLDRESLELASSEPLRPRSGNVWEGEFELVGSGKFRVELRSPEELGGYPSRPQPDRAFRAQPDLPPASRVRFQSDGARSVEVRLDSPHCVPLTIDAADDVGVDVIRIRTGRLGAVWSSRVVYRALGSPRNAVHLETTLDEAAKLKPGESMRFQVEVQDTRGQKACTDEYIVRVVGAVSRLSLVPPARGQDELLVKRFGRGD